MSGRRKQQSIPDDNRHLNFCNDCNSLCEPTDTWAHAARTAQQWRRVHAYPEGSKLSRCSAQYRPARYVLVGRRVWDRLN